jgi:hypothetical protein
VRRVGGGVVLLKGEGRGGGLYSSIVRELESGRAGEVERWEGMKRKKLWGGSRSIAI